MGETAQGDSASEVLVVVAPKRRIVGRVVDEQGALLPDARCELILPEDYRTRHEGGLGRSSTACFVARSDESGAFELTGPNMLGVRLLVTRAGFVERAIEVSAALELSNIVLARRQVRGPRIAGRVLDGSGRPLGGALVSNGEEMIATSTDGGFELEVNVETREIVAFMRGEGVVVHRLNEPSLDAGSPAATELQLQPSLTARGRVVDPAGKAIGGVRLWLADGTVCEVRANTATGHRRGFRRFVERLLAEKKTEVDALSLSDGSFELHGLLDREYTLVALDPESHTRTQLHFHPDDAHELTVVLDPHALHEVVRGRVESSTGDPMQGVDIRFTTRAGEDPPGVSNEIPRHAVERTGPDGFFLLIAVPRENAFVEISGGGVLRKRVPVDKPDELTIVVERAVHLRVELRDPRGGESFCVLDSDGARLPLHRSHGSKSWIEESAPLFTGRSEVVAVSDRASRLVVYRGKTLVADRELAPPAGELTIIRVHRFRIGARSRQSTLARKAAGCRSRPTS